jgi:CheY-like chemotaxis protein
MTGANRTSGKSVLLVDDDDSARESIKLLLSIDRHLVAEARNGQEAIELFTKLSFDLVILDFAMPGMQGAELAQRLRALGPKVPILMVTAYLEKLTEADKPVDAVLAKPFGVDELRQTIAKLIG